MSHNKYDLPIVTTPTATDLPLLTPPITTVDLFQTKKALRNHVQKKVIKLSLLLNQSFDVLLDLEALETNLNSFFHEERQKPNRDLTEGEADLPF